MMKLKTTTLLNHHMVPESDDKLSRVLIKKGGPQAEFYAEYVLPIGEESELEAGYVGEFFQRQESLIWVKTITTTPGFGKRTWANQTILFSTQNIHALYATFSHSFEHLSFMAGLRAEQALITSNLVTLDSIVPNNYFRVYPTLHLAYELNGNQQIQFNYSHRVKRPDSDEMNPFPEYSDPRNMESGNPRVKTRANPFH